MKIFASILSVYLLLLIAIPCCSFDTCPDKGVKKEITGKESEKSQQDCGTCSPFFQCERCATVTMPVEQLALEPAADPAKSRYAEYKVPFIPAADSEHWRPPQL